MKKVGKIRFTNNTGIRGARKAMQRTFTLYSDQPKIPIGAYRNESSPNSQDPDDKTSTDESLQYSTQYVGDTVVLRKSPSTSSKIRFQKRFMIRVATARLTNVPKTKYGIHHQVLPSKNNKTYGETQLPLTYTYCYYPFTVRCLASLDTGGLAWEND